MLMYLFYFECIILQRIAGTKVFGVPLPSLMSENDKVPAFLENLIMSIELHGIYTEGIYRKSGSANKIKKLKDAIDLGQTGMSLIFLLTSIYCIRPNYHTYSYKCTVKQFRSLQITASVLFVYIFIKTYVVVLI